MRSAIIVLGTLQLAIEVQINQARQPAGFALLACATAYRLVNYGD
jgi:hypothetical protein